MKLFTFLLSTALVVNLSAQSLQDSFNKALTKADSPSTENKVAKNTPLSTLTANIDYSQNGVQLKWDITPENSSKQFIIEKSTDKMTWEKISAIPGASTRQLIEYFYIDFQPLQALSYYRIVQVNEDGQETASNIIPVNYIDTEYKTAGINLFPTPTHGEDSKIINIAWEEIFDKEVFLVLRDTKGEEYYSKAIINIEDEKLIAVPVEKQLPKGNYLITASSENQIYSQNITIN